MGSHATMCVRSSDGQPSGTAGNSQNNAVKQARISRVPASDDIPDDLEDRPLLAAKKGPPPNPHPPPPPEKLLIVRMLCSTLLQCTLCMSASN